MPKLWTHTIEAHRAAVRGATLDAAGELIAAHGLTGVTMSRLAATTGIGRATLYKYFPDVDAVLLAWHDRQVGQHLAHLARVRDHTDPPRRLAAVLTAYARMGRHRHGGDLAATLHRSDHVTTAHQRLRQLVADLLTDDTAAGRVRDDIPAAELAAYCLHALAAADAAPSEAAVDRLVAVTLAGLRPVS